MKHWYSVSVVGWLVAVLHLVLSFLIVYGLVSYDESQPIWYIYNGGFIIQGILLGILLFAKLKKQKLFAKAAKGTSAKKAFTLVELLIVISIISILAQLAITQVGEAREKARLTRAEHELKSIHESLLLYQMQYGDFPDDTNRDIPPGLEEFLAPGIWPDGAWEGSVFDWENWEDPDDPDKRILQISLRFCPVGQPAQCKFPEADWAENFDINSSVYYCIEGACRSHINRPINHPGYCVNCQN
jgi:prepilin-type N-terminal cleavage/methylation domain-containing protein